ncbi:MAG: prolyl oligopeptidase family serine peptidase [Opitutaceae bacterium]|nr:prolyl oligopeptidase family serine peptidase [Opitutaceae bacterium]
MPANTSDWNYQRDVLNRPVGQDARPPASEAGTEEVFYWLFLPADYGRQAAAEGAPLVLSLHGAGSRGSEPAKVMRHGMAKLLEEPAWAAAYPAVVVSPQCKAGARWSPRQLLALLDEVEKELKINKSRVYVTGLSLGGFGTWMLLAEAPGRFAAAAPICGGGKTEWAGRMSGVPIWVFHGDADTKVPIGRSVEMVEALKKAGARQVVLTIYKGGGHDVFTRTYANPLFHDWLLSQRK